MHIIKEEKKYLFYHIIIVALITLFISLSGKLFTTPDDIMSYFLIIWCIVLMLKYIVIRLGFSNKNFIKKLIFNIIRLMELIICAMVVAKMKYTYNLGITIVYLFMALESYMLMRRINLTWYKVYYVLLFLLGEIIIYKWDVLSVQNIFYIAITVLTFFIIEGEVRSNILLVRKKFKENKNLLETIRKRNIKLRLKEAEIQDLLKKYKNEVAELYILKEIANFVNNSLEQEEFIENCMDAIIGVIEVSLCGMVLFDGKENIREVYVKTVSCLEDKKSLNKMLLAEVKNKFDPTKIVTETSLTCSDDTYFEVIIPLVKNNINYGAIILAYKDESYFDESMLKLLEDVAKEIVLALENVILYEKLKDTASRDSLTQLHNRAYLKKMWPEIAKKVDDEKQKLVLAIADIDNFKKINDTYGHVYGDDVLKELTVVAKDTFHKYGGNVIRYGGEEFLIIIPNMDEEGACKVLEEFRKNVETNIINIAEHTIGITISVGFTIYPTLDSKIDKAIDSADKALYESKRTGKNKVSMAKKK